MHRCHMDSSEGAMTDKPKPCPFCKCPIAKAEWASSPRGPLMDRIFAAVVCKNSTCGARGPIGEGKDGDEAKADAIRKWNKGVNR